MREPCAARVDQFGPGVFKRIDYTSPEAAAAAGAWAALRNAGSHVLSASVAGQELLATGGSLDAARDAWSAAGIRVLREFGGTL